MTLIAPDPTTAVAWHTALEMAGIFAGIRLFGANAAVTRSGRSPATADSPSRWAA
jgi:hypothetical protein